MTTTPHRQDQGRAALAAALVDRLLEQLPLAHPARETARELQQLFGRKIDDVRTLLERVPGKSLAKKGERIGIPKGSVWAIWKGKYIPSPEILAKIEAAATAPEEAA